MAVKTFTDNTPLPASDINTYLANSGLVYVTQASFSTQTTCAIDNVFSTDFDTYRIVVQILNVGNTGTILFRYRAAGSAITTPYYYGGTVYYTNANATFWYNGASASTNYPVIISTNGTQAQAQIDIQNPRTAYRKQFIATATHNYSTYAGATVHGFLSSTATNLDGFQFTQDAGNAITANVQVYGYRKA